MIKIRLTLRPGQNGTRKLVEKYGEKLVAVRYRYDLESCRRLKTVEIIEEAVRWEPRGGKVYAATVVAIRVEWRETSLRQKVKQAGGHWDATHKVWILPRDAVGQLGLESRIVPGPSAGRNIRTDG